MTTLLATGPDLALWWIFALAALLWLGVVVLGVVQAFLCLFTADGWKSKYHRPVAVANVLLTGIALLYLSVPGFLDSKLAIVCSVSLIAACILALPRRA